MNPDKRMSTKRKQSIGISIECKLKVLQDYDGKKSKVEVAKLNGISPTSVTRILSNRQELEALRGIVADPDQSIDDTNDDQGSATEPSNNDIESIACYDDPIEPQPHQRIELIFDDPEASFEKALKQLEQYTIQLIMECELLIHADNVPISPDDSNTNQFGGLYELYDELMENEFSRRNFVC